MRSSGFRPASVERKSVERRSAFEVTTLYAQTLHALRVLAGHNVRITPEVWKLFLHELLADVGLPVPQSDRSWLPPKGVVEQDSSSLLMFVARLDRLKSEWLNAGNELNARS